MGDKLYQWKENNINLLQTDDALKEDNIEEQILLGQNDVQKQQIGGPTGIKEDHDDPEKLDKTRRKVEKNMPKPFEFYGRARLLTEKKYSYKSDGELKAATREGNTKYMKPVVDNLSVLDRLLEGPIDLERWEDLRDAFLNSCRACENYLEKRKNPRSDEGKARYAIVQDFYDQISDESVRFGHMMEELNAHPEKLGTYQNWITLLAQVRAEKGDDGENRDPEALSKEKVVQDRFSRILDHSDLITGSVAVFDYICKKNGQNAGKFTLPLMDRKFTYQVLVLQPEMIDYQMSDVLKKDDRESFVGRIKEVQKAIRTRMKEESKEYKKNKSLKSIFITEEDKLESAQEKNIEVAQMTEKDKEDKIKAAFSKLYNRNITAKELEKRKKHLNSNLEYVRKLQEHVAGAEEDLRPKELTEQFERIGELSEEEKTSLITKTEDLFVEILQMNDFSEFNFTFKESFLKKDMKKLLKVASLGRNASGLFDIYMKYRTDDAGFSLTNDDLRELHAKILLLEEISKEYKTQVDLLSNDYYLYFNNDDTSYINKTRAKGDPVTDTKYADFVNAVKARTIKVKERKKSNYPFAEKVDANILLNRVRSKTGSKFIGYISFGKGEERSDVLNRGKYLASDQTAIEKLDNIKNALNDDLASNDLSKDTRGLLKSILTYVEFLRKPGYMADYSTYKKKTDPEVTQRIKEMIAGRKLVGSLKKTGEGLPPELGQLSDAEGQILLKYKELFSYDMTGELEIPTGDVVVKDSLVGYNYVIDNSKKPLILNATDDKEEQKFRIKEHRLEEKDEVYANGKVYNRGKTVAEDVSGIPLFDKEPCISDLYQGNVGDCYFIAAMNAVLEKDASYIKKMMKDHGDHVTVRFYTIDKRPVYVKVKKTVYRYVYRSNDPADGEVRGDYRGCGRDGSALWAMLLEKAYAYARPVLEKSTRYDMENNPGARDLYTASVGGYDFTALRILKGIDEPEVFNQTNIDKRFEGLVSYDSFLEKMRKDARQEENEKNGQKLSNAEWNIKKAKIFCDLELFGTDDPRYELFQKNTIFKAYSDFVGKLMKERCSGTKMKTDTDLHMVLYALENAIDRMPDFIELGGKKENRKVKEAYLKYLGKYMMRTDQLKHIISESGHYEKKEDDFFYKVKQAAQDNKMMTSSVANLTLSMNMTSQSGFEKTMFGLAAPHSYTVLDAVEEEATVQGETRMLKYIIVMNPWKNDMTRQYDKTTGLPFLRSGRIGYDSPLGTYKVELKDYLHMFRYTAFEK